jgi:DNA-binding transcriptional LysR family regulator
LQQHPSANVEIEAANSPEVIAQVMNYEVDIGMIEGGTNHPNLDLIPWIQDELTVFVSPDHPLAAKKQITDQDLKNARWIMRERDSGARKTFEQRFIKLLPQMEIYLEFRHNEAIKRAVESSLGVGCLSRIVLESSFREGNLVPLKLPQKYDLRRTFYFVLVKNRYVKRAAETWLNMCLEISHSG